MAQKQSGAVRGVGHGPAVEGCSQAAAFLGKANVLLLTMDRADQQAVADAMDAGAAPLSRDEIEDRFRTAYQAALRLVGAILESAFVHRKRRPRGNGWVLLSNYGGQFAPWADAFLPYSEIMSRMSMGLSYEFSEEDLAEFEELVRSFANEVNGYFGWMPDAA